MNKAMLRKGIACVLAAATIGTGYILPIAPAIVSSGIVVNAASTVKTKGDYKYQEVSGGVKFLGYADVTYDKNDNEIYYYPKSTTMTIPATIGGKTVIAIGTLENIDDYKDTCKVIEIPARVKAIDADVFRDFSNVKTLTFKGTAITSIDSNAFAGCSSLTEINFKNASKLTIGASAFSDCDKLKIVTFGTGGATVKEAAFADLSSLTTVDMNVDAKATIIGVRAFAGSGVKKITLPKETTSIGANAFEDCSNLATVNLTQLTKITTLNEATFAGTAIKNILIPSGVTVIKDRAFADIVNTDSYDELVFSTLTFKNASNKIKCSESAFDGCNIDSVVVPENMYNTTTGVLSAATFGNVYNSLKITSKTQKITGIGDMDADSLTVTSPFGSYVWACIQNAKYQDSESGVPSYIKFKGDLEYNDGTNAKYNYSTVTLKEVSSNTADGVNVKYTTPIAKSDVNNGTGAKDLVVTVNTGVTTWKLNSVSLVKKLFTYNDAIAANGLSGTFAIETKSNTGVKLSSKISKTYNIQAENFDSANVSFDTTTDASKGIYNKTYGCYVASSESAVVKPTIIVKLGDKVIDSKYYTVTYKDNTGIRANNSASLTVALNDEGKKLYNSSKTFTKKFTIKMDINKVNVGVNTFIAQGKTSSTGDPVALSDDANKSGFKSVGVGDSPKTTANDQLVCTVKLNNSSTASQLKNNTDKLKLSLVYDEDTYFSHIDVLGSDINTGVVKATLKAAKDSPYFIGERDIEYYTKFNINKYNKIQAVKDESIVNASKKTVNSSSYWLLDSNYTYTGGAITPGTWVLSVKNNNLVTELPANMFTVTYGKNVNASKTNTTNDMAYVTLSAASNQTYLFGSRKIYFKINQATITGDLFSIASQTYTGEKIAPSITARYKNMSMVKGTDYKVTFTNNIEPGTAKAEITGQGNFNGTVTKTFTINKVNLANCTVKWTNNTVSWRFGFDIKPVPEVYFKGKLLTRGTDYNVVYLGKYVNNKYTGNSVKSIGETGGVAIVPTTKSKIISDSTTGLTSVTYGSNSTKGIVKGYTVAKLNLANIDFQYPDTLVSDAYSQFKANLIPSILINGQVIKAYKPTEVRSIIYNFKYKPKNQAFYYTYSDIPYDDAKTICYYGYETSSGTGFQILGKMIRDVDNYKIKGDKTYNNYRLVQDTLFMKNGNGAMVQVSKFYYTTDYDNANPDSITDGMGIKVEDVKYNVNGVGNAIKDVVRPGVLHVYTTGSVESENRSMLSDENTTGYEHAWDIYIKPASTYATTDAFEIQDNKPGTLNIRFKPSTADIFRGNIAYEIALFATKADAKNYTNAIKTYSVKYNSNDFTGNSNKLTLSKIKSGSQYYLYYDYMISGVSPGKLYYVNIKAIDNKTKAESPVYAYPKQYYSTTSRAEIDSAYYKANGANYDLHVDLKLPSHVSGTTSDMSGISNIFYEVEIRSSSNNVLTTYRVSETGKIDNKTSKKLTKNANGTWGITFSSVPGMNAESNYYVSVHTYLYFFTGNYTSNTYKFECTKNANGVRAGTFTVQAYNKDKDSVVLKTDKNVVNGNSLKATATLKGSWASKAVSCVFKVYDNTGKNVYTSADIKANKGVAEHTIAATKFVNITDSNVKYKVEVVATYQTADSNKTTSKSTVEINVSPSIKNNSSINNTKINKNGKVAITLKASSTYSGVNTYNLTVNYCGTDSTCKNVKKSTKIFSGVQKQNGSVYELSGEIFDSIGYYGVVVTASDNNQSGKSKTFKVQVVNEPVNTSSAAVVTGYIDDGIQVDCSATLLTGKKYKVQVFESDTNKKIYDATTNESTVHIDIANISGVVSGKYYYVIVTATGNYNGKSYELKSNKLSVGTLTCTNLLNTSIIDRTEVLQDAGESVTITPSSKYGPLGKATYALELENVSTGNITKYSVNSNGVFKIVADEKKDGKYVLHTGNYVARVKATKGKETAIQEFYVSIKNESSFIKSIDFSIPDTGDIPKLTAGDNKSKGLLKVNKTFEITVKPAVTSDIKFEYKKSVNAKWLEVENTAESGYTYNIKSDTKTNYDIRITVKTNNGRVITKTYTNIGVVE